MEKIKVADVYMLHGTASKTISCDASLEEVVAAFSNDPKLRRVFLVNAEGRFSGDISISNLLKWVRSQFFGSEKAYIKISAWELVQLVSAAKACELVYRNWQGLGVKLTEVDPILRTGLAPS